MKIVLKIILIILASMLIMALGALIFFYSATKDVTLDSNKLVNMNKTVSFYDQNNNFLFKEGENNTVTPISDIPIHVQKAFIAIEDKRFYSHNGIDYKGLFRATLSNIKSFSFKEGGSTISQQLIKNTHLSNQKTLKRKLTEIKLAKQLEKKYSKDEILEKYLNTIYFGDNCYGITKASKHYFDKSPSELSVNEGATLAGIIKAPSNYSPDNNAEKCKNRKDLVIEQMYAQGYIDKSLYEENYGKDITISKREQEKSSYDFMYLAKKELNELIKNNPYVTDDLKVYTTLNPELQEIIENEVNCFDDVCDKTATVIDKQGRINAYYSTCGNISRQLGSTIKPLLVYAPAIENNVVYSCSPILDEKTDFNGYSPSNYNDKYYGIVSVKDSLAKSLNSCSVKLLNYTGINKAKSYIEKTPIKFSNNDNSLSLALGASENGSSLIELCSAYDIFLNEGNYVSPYLITEIRTQNNNILYKKHNDKIKVFSSETTHIINDMLEYTVKEGTAKKLSFTNIPLCSKTGTVGNKNGNIDAYNISYNSEKILGVWFGNKDNSLLENSISGGTAPTRLASCIWKESYKDKSPPESFIRCNQVCEKFIDKIEYEQNNNVLLANDYTPPRYTLKGLFKNNHLPQISKSFSEPYINSASVNLTDEGIKVLVDLSDFYNVQIYRQNKNTKKLVYDTKNGNNFFIDKNIIPDTEYVYSIIPYFIGTTSTVCGKEIFLQKIKTPTVSINDWWTDDLN